MTARSVGVSYRGLSRVAGESALARSGYQMGSTTRTGSRCAPKGGSAHLKQWLWTPACAPDWASERTRLWERAGLAERRYDAQEARIFDVTWPRVLPLDLVDEFVAELFAPFRAVNLAVQVDLEVKTASDGLPNPHIHGLISTRPLNATGFARLKDRNLTAWFAAEGGKRPRRVVAEILTRLSSAHGIAATFDHRSNVERGLPHAEDRLPRSYIRRPDTKAAREALSARDRQRALRNDWRATAAGAAAVERAVASLLKERDALFASVPRLRPIPPDMRAHPVPPSVWEVLSADLPSDTGRPIDLGIDGIAIPVGDGAVVDRGSEILIEGPLNNDVGLVLQALVSRKSWTRTSLVDASGRAPASPAWFAIPGSASPGNERTLGPLERLGIDVIVSATRGHGPAPSPTTRILREVTQRLRIVELGCIADPTNADVQNLITSAMRRVPAPHALWEGWKTRLELAAVGVKAPTNGRGRRSVVEPHAHIEIRPT